MWRETVSADRGADLRASASPPHHSVTSARRENLKIVSQSDGAETKKGSSN